VKQSKRDQFRSIHSGMMQMVSTESDEVYWKQNSLFVSEREEKSFRPFDLRYSTEDYNSIVESKCKVKNGYSVRENGYNNSNSEQQLFFGAYGHLRKKLDYSYHCHYRKERQWLHDSIIEDFLEYQEEQQIPFDDGITYNMKPNLSSNVNVVPWLILSVGVQGAGKHYTINKLVQTKHLRLLSFVSIAPGM
jgi:hypothetical protein